MNSVVHFEMPYEDRNRMAKFYESAFNWQTQMLGEEMGAYVLATTTATDANGRPTQPGAINGGFFRRMEGGSAQSVTFVIGVDDLNASIERVLAAGGELLGEPHDIPGVGRQAHFKDPEGNVLSMLQPTPMNGRAPNE